MNCYKVLNKQVFQDGNYKLVPIRIEDRYLIMTWRNEQIYHLRQSERLLAADQDAYFEQVVSKLFDQETPDQILFSYLEDQTCIGYGGLVHINWIDKNAELSFIINTELENEFFNFHWQTYLKLIEKVAFEGLGFHKVFTYAYDLRQILYDVLELSGYECEARLKQHCLFEGKFIDVIIHSKINTGFNLRDVTIDDLQMTYYWANHPHTRKFAFNKDYISLENHLNWLKEKLYDENCIYKILMKGTIPVGSIRFDIENDVGVISYLISPELTGMGYGTKILEHAVAIIGTERPTIKTLKGVVKMGNDASIRIFEKLGFEKTEFNDGSLEYMKRINYADRG